MSLTKFKGIIANVAAVIGLFFPIFTIEFLEKSLSSASSWGLNYYDLDGSLSPLDIVSFFDGWLDMFHDLSVDTTVIAIPFILFIILEIIAAIFLVKSITNLNYSLGASQDYSKKSIISLLVLYIIGLFTVFLFNSTVANASRDSDMFTSYVAKQLEMEFPVAALIFLGVCIAGIAWINHDEAPSASSAYSTSSAKAPIGWICPKCGTENSNHTTHCSECDAKRITATFSGGETQSNKWYCSSCGKENSKLLSECTACGKAKSSILPETAQVAQAAQGAITKIKDVGSAVAKQLGNSNDNFEKIKQLKELYDMGAINQDEFEAKKKELLKL